MTGIINILLEVFGGLGLFLYGMKVMSDGLEQSAGDKMESIIKALTKNKFIGVIVGALVTVVVASSSATTVMVVGFVNAGIMSLTQAIGIIMGANIGTTISTQMVSLDLTAIAPIAIGLGVMIKLFTKKERVRQYADILIGFGILFLGMDLMKSAMKPLRSYQGFKDMLLSFGSGSFTDVIFAVLTGFGITAIIQSSSATTGLLVALASQGLLPIESALPIAIGANIGTCVTAMISSIGANKNAKRAALMHLIFNVVGAFIVLIFLRGPLIHLVKQISDTPQRQLANAHTIFNIGNTVALIFFSGVIVNFVKKVIPEGVEEKRKVADLKYLDNRILETPSIAIVQTLKEVLHMGNLAKESLEASIKGLVTGDKEEANKVFRIEKHLNKLEKEISRYLYQFNNKDISPHQRKIIEGLFSVISDIERVGDHGDNIAELAYSGATEKIQFSEVAVEEIEYMYSRVMKSFKQALNSLQSDDLDLARKILEREGEIDAMEKKLRKKHIKRLNNGKCNPNAGVLFLDTISNLERIADHASNIALTILEKSEKSA